MSTRGILAYGAYVPYHRLELTDIGTVLGVPSTKGRRAVAGYDEDATSMGVEAARRAMASGGVTQDVYFATTSPPYADKTNAVAIHSALGLDPKGFAIDLGASIRSAAGALRSATRHGGLAVLGDLRIGLPGSADEREGGDGAAAFLFGEGNGVVAAVVAEASATSEFLDRWRRPGDLSSQVWEERFGRSQYLPLIADAVGRVLTDGGIDAPDHVVVSSPHQRVAATVSKGYSTEVSAAHALQRQIGYAGTADLGLKLAEVLDRAQPGETILLVLAADGCDATLLRVTDAITDRRSAPRVLDQVACSQPVDYGDFLTWRGVLKREPPRRPDPPVPAGPPSARNERWKFGFSGSRCQVCGTVHIPPQRICVSCEAIDQMTEQPLANAQGTIATYTADRLAFSLAPPLIDAVVDFDGGGRRQCEMTDVRPEEMAVGGRVEMTFRRMYTAGDVHNYFWKARPVRNGGVNSESEEDSHGQ